MSTSAESGTMIIVGAGQAGGTAAMELRKQGYDGRVLIISQEAHIPYKRPPLSKAYFSGDAKLESLYVMQAENLAKNRIECLTGTAATAIDPATHSLTLADGTALNYDKLLLATGGRPRPLPVEGADSANVFLLRTIDDVDAIRERCTAGKRLVIIGGGFIGLEVAASATKLGAAVTVLESLPRVLARVTAPQVSEFFENAHRSAGVDLRTGATVSALHGSPEINQVVLDDDTTIEADLVVIGIGLIPNTDLASSAGLEVEDGIVVNRNACTSNPDIFAAGDCTRHPSPFFGRSLRLESVQNAMDQSRTAAANMLGKQQIYDAVPWFWSDQFDLKLQMVGLSAGHDDTVLRGDPASGSFAMFYLRRGQIIAVDTISRPKDFMVAKRLVAARAKPDLAQLADESVDLKDLVPA